MSKQWGRLMEALTRPAEFDPAWREVGEAGVGSIVAAERVARLIRDSKWHREKLEDTAADLLRLYADFADAPTTDESLRELMRELIHRLVTVAASYTVMGAAVGVLRIAQKGEGEPTEGERVS